MNQQASKSLSKEDIAQLVELWKQSGKSKKDFAEEYGLKYYTFVDWTRERNRRSVNNTSKFVQITSPISSSSIFAELHLTNGHRLVFFQPFSAEYIKNILK